MDVNIVASSNYDEACAVVGTKEFSCLGLLESKFIVITLKQNRPHDIIKVRYFSPTLIFQEALFEIVLMINLFFFALLSILPPNDPTNINDIESLYLLDNFANQEKLWRSSLTLQVNQENLPELFLSIQAYLSVSNVIQIILTLAATTVEDERSFSRMTQFKTWLRSRMTLGRLSDLCVLHTITKK